MAKGDRQPPKSEVPTKVEKKRGVFVVPPPPSYLARLLGSHGVKPGVVSKASKASKRGD